MSDSEQVDAIPELAGEEDVTPTETTGNSVDMMGLTNVFDETPPETEEEPSDSSVDNEVEEPAAEPEETPQPEDESSLTAEEEPSQGEEEEDEEPEWFRKRFDALTRQRKEAEERVAELEAKLSDQEAQQQPLNINVVTDSAKLDELEKQSREAQDAFQDKLDEGPQYAEDDYDKENPYYLIGEDKWTREQIIEGRNNARDVYREIPRRRMFVEQQQAAEAEIDKQFSFFTDKNDEYYQFAMDSIKSDFYKKILMPATPNAKEMTAWMIHGKRDLDRKAKEKKNQAKQVPAKKIPSSPPSRAVTDTSSAVPPPSESTPSSQAKTFRQSIKTGDVNRDALMKAFEKEK